MFFRCVQNIVMTYYQAYPKNNVWTSKIDKSSRLYYYHFNIFRVSHFSRDLKLSNFIFRPALSILLWYIFNKIMIYNDYLESQQKGKRVFSIENSR